MIELPGEPPEVLYKYRAWGIGTAGKPAGNEYVRSFLRGEVYFADLEKLNDPFEMRVRLIWPSSEKELLHVAAEIVKAKHPELPEGSEQWREMVIRCRGVIINEDRETANWPSPQGGVFSLCEKNDDLRMWAHYADSHRGICVGVSTSVLRNYGVRKKRKGPYRKSMYQVRYTEEMPELNLSDLLSSDDRHLLTMGLSKSADWEHEKEWRAIHCPAGPWNSSPNLICEVIFGTCCSQATRSEIRDVLAGATHSIRWFEARRNSTKYAVDIVELP